MSDRRELQAGDRAAIYGGNVYGTVRSSNLAVTVLDGDDHVTYTVPTVLVSWVPPADEPELVIGAIYSEIGTPGDEGPVWFYLPDTTSDSPFISVTDVVGDKCYRRFHRRDQLPRRIERVGLA